MDFTLRRRDIAVLCAIGTVFLPITFPLFIAAGVHAGKKAANERRRSRERIASIMEKVGRAAISPEFNTELQSAFDRAVAEPSFDTFTTLAVGLFAKQDLRGAHTFFTKAEELASHGGGNASTVPLPKRALVAYLHGLAVKPFPTCDYGVEHFKRAAQLLSDCAAGATFTFEVEGQQVPTISRVDALFQVAHSGLLDAHYPCGSGGSDTQQVLTSCLRSVREAIEAVLAIDATDMRAKLLHAFILFGLSDAENRELLELANDSVGEVIAWCRSVDEDVAEAEGVRIANACTLQVYTLIALGRYDDAREAVRAFDAEELGGPAKEHWTREALFEWASPGCDPSRLRSLLTRRWPNLADIAIAADSYGSGFHDFRAHVFATPTFCDFCMRWISPSSSAGGAFRCRECKFEVHGCCLERAKKQFCFSASAFHDPAIDETHTHVFIEHRMHRVRECVVCRSFIMIGRTGGQCQQCNCYAHKRCMSLTSAVHTPK